MAREHDELPRVFEGAQVLQGLLEASGTFADVDDVAEAFRLAVKEGAPPQAVIEALWAEEPHFDSPDAARRLFSNLLALHALISQGEPADLLAATPVKVKAKREQPPKPEPFEGEPDDGFVEAAWRWLEDTPREAQKLSHAFDNTQDALVGWLDAKGLDDDAFALASQVSADVFAILAVGGKKPKRVVERDLEKADAAKTPEALTHFVEQCLLESELPDDAAEALRPVLGQVAAALWATARR